jgi:hypothetical protein
MGRVGLDFDTHLRVLFDAFLFTSFSRDALITAPCYIDRIMCVCATSIATYDAPTNGESCLQQRNMTPDQDTLPLSLRYLNTTPRFQSLASYG